MLKNLINCTKLRKILSYYKQFKESKLNILIITLSINKSKFEKREVKKKLK